MAIDAVHFLESLSTSQKSKAQFAFDDEERYHWNYVPVARKGISINELSPGQNAAAMLLLRNTLSNTGYEKTTEIMQLEAILKIVENRDDSDHYRDAGKYFFSIFGKPGQDSIWGWRFEGHHISFNFSSDATGLVSGTPGFLGANPAMVLSGKEKGKEILKDETRLGFDLLNSLNAGQKTKAIISATAFPEIITGASRKAEINSQEGILFSELESVQQQLFTALIGVYMQRYKEPYVSKMMNAIAAAGKDNLRFAWAGAQQHGPGNPHYYRIHGPTIIIEYDNTQNNANHVHTVVRDLKNDFGGDELLEHYKKHVHQ